MGKKAKRLKSRIEINVYEVDKEDPETFKPEITFKGEVLSVKGLETISFLMKKALRHYKIKMGEELKKGESDG